MIVAAIDFGTTYSGFAYCKHIDYRKNPANPSIYCQQWINDGPSNIREKAPTCVLFDQDEKFHSFGFDAVNYFYENAETTDFTKWFYFEHFKMMLFKEKVISSSYEMSILKHVTRIHYLELPFSLILLQMNPIRRLHIKILVFRISLQITYLVFL